MSENKWNQYIKHVKKEKKRKRNNGLVLSRRNLESSSVFVEQMAMKAVTCHAVEKMEWWRFEGDRRGMSRKATEVTEYHQDNFVLSSHANAVLSVAIERLTLPLQIQRE